MAKVCSLSEGSPPFLPAAGIDYTQAKGTLTPVLLLGFYISHSHTICPSILALTRATFADTGNPDKERSLTGRLRPDVLYLAASNFKSLAMNSCRAT